MLRTHIIDAPGRFRVGAIHVHGCIAPVGVAMMA